MRLRYEDAVKSKVYREIIDYAADRIHDVGAFKFSDALKATGYAAIGSSVRWDYVKRIIERKYNTKLFPVPSSYFERHSEELDLKKLVARGGKTKRGVGFISVTRENGRLVKHLLDIQRKV